MNSPYRKSGLLPKLKSERYPKRLLFFDTETELKYFETIGYKQVLKVGCAIYVELDINLNEKYREVYIFNSIKEFVEIIKRYDKSRKQLTCFAHNTAFDIEVLDLPNQFDKLGYSTDLPITNYGLMIWKVKSKRGTILFLDTFNYIPRTLEKIGSDIGMPKIEIDFNTCSYEELRDYCLNDTKIIEKFILNLMRFMFTNNLGSFGWTTASNSFTSYRHRFMNIQPLIHNNPDILELERNAYYGGRVECHYIGTKNDDTYYYLDINSAYPYIMKNKEIPYRLKSNDLRYSRYNFEFHINYNYVIAHVILNTNINAFPKHHNNKLVFPIGRYDTYLHNTELKFALEHNLIDDIVSYVVYDKINLFSDYIDFYYDIKKKADISGDLTTRTISKLFMTNLYGKFAQRYNDSIKIGFSPELGCKIITVVLEEKHNRYREIHWFGRKYRVISEGESTYSFPAIAGAITSETRMLLFDYMQLAKTENLLYNDTDSLIVNSLGYNNLSSVIDNHELGMLKIEETMDEITIFGCKDYEYGNKQKRKGIPKNAIEYEDGKFYFEQFEGFKTWRNRGAIGEPLLFGKIKQRLSEYNKGILNKETNYVTPLIMNE